MSINIITCLGDIKEFAQLDLAKTPLCILVFSHPDIAHGLTNDGIPQVNLDQLNPCLNFPSSTMSYQIKKVFDGNVYNYVTKAIQLTCGKLLKADDWADWQKSEWTQLDQYNKHGVFIAPVCVATKEAIFNFVRTYGVKVVDRRKKARCTCDGPLHWPGLC